MGESAFTLRLDDVTGAQAIVAAWVALKASAWAMYQAKQAVAISRASGALPSRQLRLDMLRDSFTQVAKELPPDDPFAAELLRYHDEAAVHDIGEDGDSIPKWVN